MTIMRSFLLPSTLPLVFACTLLPQLARADIYTWTDASGRINVSNLAPPQGARVTNVVHERSPAASAPLSDAARNAARDAEVQALEERVRELQDGVERARRQAPAPMDYRPIPEPPAARYGVAFAPPVVQYADAAAPAANPGCDATWVGCGPWWGPGIYPASVVVLRTPSFHRFHPARGGHRMVARHPLRMPGGFRRR
jgi:hypothetical protein